MYRLERSGHRQDIFSDLSASHSLAQKSWTHGSQLVSRVEADQLVNLLESSLHGDWYHQPFSA